MLRFGIIGTGGIADNAHAPAINALGEASLAAVLSRDTARGQDFLLRHQAANATAHVSLDAFATDPNIDAVIITSPDKMHAPQTIACLRAGKHVLVEKPMATSAADAEAMVQAAQQSGKVLAVGFHLRQHNGNRLLFDAIHQQQALGTLRHIRVIWARAMQKDEYNWRTNEETSKWWSLAAVGSHCLDQVRWFAQDSADWQQFTAIINRNKWQGAHDETAIIAAQLASGPTVEVVSSVQFGVLNRIEIYGDNGTAIGEGTTRMGSQVITLNDQPLPFVPENPFVAQLAHFIDCIKTGRQPIADGTVGLRSVKDLLLASA